ncbi:MAG: hypothetical protein ACRDOP_11720, partial [Gaiellaceae bacterium]
MDPDDGVPGGNMPEVHERLGAAMERAERHGARLAVLHVHLGFEAGVEPETVRGQVALRLTNALRATDAVLPGGPDSLLLLLPGVESVGDAAVVARKVVRVLAEPLAVGGGLHRVD